MTVFSEVRTTPFHARCAALNGRNRWIERNGWTLAADYGDLESEALAARSSAIMTDISWRWRIVVEGARAAEFLSRLLTKDVSRLDAGNSLKALWLSDRGGVRGAGAIARFGSERFLLAASAADYVWIASAAKLFDVTVRDVSEDECGLALIGPLSSEVLKAAGLQSDLALLEFRKQSWRDVNVTLSRWGEHGGYEIWCRRDDAQMVWDYVAAAGAALSILPAGLAAADILDLERGVARPLRDYQPAQLGNDAKPTPLSLGLEKLIDENHAAFNGRGAWLSARAREALRFVGIEFDSETAPAKFAILNHHGEVAGRVMAAAYSPALRRAIALGQVAAKWSATGISLQVALPPSIPAHEPAIGRVVDLPFLPSPETA